MSKAVKSEVLWSKSLLSHVCSLWYMVLPSLLAHHWNKMGTLVEAMDLLEDMRLNNTLPSDEVITHTHTHTHTLPALMP